MPIGILMFRFPVAAVLKLFEPGRHQGALRFVQVPAAQIERNHIGDWIVARVGSERGFDPGRFTSPKAVAPVEDHPLMQDYWLMQPVLADIRNKLVEVRPFD